MKNEIDKIIVSSTINGSKYWARADGDIHAPAGFSTIDVLNTLGNLGVKYNDYPIIIETIDFIFNYYDPKGCFRYCKNSSKLPCITARILTALGRLGYKDDRIERCYQYLLNSQENDGGWRCPTVKIGRSPQTDASNPGTTLYVLDAFQYRFNNERETRQLEKGITFLLNHWETRKPLGPCEFGIGSTFMKVEYPVLRYNLLYYCFVLSQYRIALNDKRFKEAIAILKSKIIDNGLLNENPHKLWKDFSFAQKGIVCEPVKELLLKII